MMWTCKCGRVSVESLLVCRGCGTHRQVYTVRNDRIVNISTISANSDSKRLKRENNAKLKNLPEPEEGSVIQSAMKKGKKK